MLKLIHGADFHLDSPFSGLDPQRAAQRRSEQRALLDDLARLASEAKADLVLLSGDLFDSDHVFRETAQTMAQALAKIPCPVLIAPGNHDYYAPGSPYASLKWPDNVCIFTAGRMQKVDLPDLNCTVWGRAFTAPHLDESPLAGFRVPDHPEDHIDLMVLHGAVGPQSSYGPISPEEIADTGLDYLALGHVHQYSGLQRAGATVWAYPGCPEGRGFDETGTKGVLYLEVEPGQVRGQLIPMCRRRYEQLTVDVTGADPLDAIRAALPADTGADIYRIILTGESSTPDLARLDRELSGRFYALTLRDQTRLPRDLWERRDEDSLTGLFLQLMEQKCREHPDDQSYQRAARFGLAALENGEDPYL